MPRVGWLMMWLVLVAFEWRGLMPVDGRSVLVYRCDRPWWNYVRFRLMRVVAVRLVVVVDDDWRKKERQCVRWGGILIES